MSIVSNHFCYLSYIGPTRHIFLRRTLIPLGGRTAPSFLTSSFAVLLWNREGDWLVSDFSTHIFRTHIADVWARQLFRVCRPPHIETHQILWAVRHLHRLCTVVMSQWLALAPRVFQVQLSLLLLRSSTMYRGVIPQRRWLHCDPSHDARPHWKLLLLRVVSLNQLFIVLFELICPHFRHWGDLTFGSLHKEGLGNAAVSVINRTVGGRFLAHSKEGRRPMAVHINLML